MLKEYLSEVISGSNLSREQAGQAMEIIMSGQASESQIGAFLTALRMKGETSAEVAGFATAMRNCAVKINCNSEPLLDTCGTGGDRSGTFNVSTTVAFVAAGAGLSVAKHGNRGVSSSCGSADVLSALGIKIDLPPQIVAQAINSIQIGFLFAPNFHQAMKYAAKPRKELGFRTVFNLLGPLTNPASANRQLIGVYERSLTLKVAEALAELGIKRAMVVYGLDGLDEISIGAPTQVSEVNNGQIRSYLIDPAQYGFFEGDKKDLQGGAPAENAEIILKILNGQPGPKRDVVLLNAAAAFVAADMADGIEEGIQIAARSIDSGAAREKLEALKRFSLLQYQNL
ncbi:MAG TPA: anthranilate phosphoribosyltransferase [Methylomusa anaerophila]|uniref:Anthranilate phosphoribosyltransferase n=1 Tax=Methylomusa anaerophila TaxID=1930071 RepID=A0A348ANR1_9FIRM|nr:anthranilate phosphoribosyltransferase [Methylomusa anaerophila]BBB92709.1 anthranilate phosphoribosyltransferase [Methylomusa anaerophila]HML87438.1 anthranilate phosphoribosyltransferase [Methylomusa anaerophila]